MKNNFYEDNGEIVNELDDTSIYQKTSIKYPHIYLESFIEELGLLLETFDTGSLPIYMENANGVKVELPMSLRNSPIEIDKILRVQPIKIVLSKDTEYTIRKIQDLLDLEGYDWTQ